MKYILIIVNLLASLGCIAIASKFVFVPYVAERILTAEYKEKMSACDAAMRSHLIAKNRVTFEKSKESLRSLKVSELGLIQCHEYDKLRKRMISLGLSNNDLAKIGLEAIEEKSIDIYRLVEIHEFKY